MCVTKGSVTPARLKTMAPWAGQGHSASPPHPASFARSLCNAHLTPLQAGSRWRERSPVGGQGGADPWTSPYAQEPQS